MHIVYYRGTSFMLKNKTSKLLLNLENLGKLENSGNEITKYHFSDQIQP